MCCLLTRKTVIRFRLTVDSDRNRGETSCHPPGPTTSLQEPHVMSEHLVTLYHLNDLGADELRRLLPGHPDLRITEIGPDEDPPAHRDARADATIVLAPLEKERRISAELLD